MKVKLLVDTTVTLKGGSVIDVDDTQYNLLKKLNRAIPFEAEPKKEVTEVKKETRKKKAEK